MESGEPSRIGDMELSETVSVGLDAFDVGVLDPLSEWVVVVDKSGPLAAVPGTAFRSGPQPLSLAAVVRDRPPSVIAHADASVAKALSSWAFGQMLQDSAVIVVDDDGRLRVWAGDDLAEVRNLAGVRSGIDASLPGDVHIPVIRRLCGYKSKLGDCPAVLAFDEFPDPMPDCPNPLGLDPHRFCW